MRKEIILILKVSRIKSLQIVIIFPLYKGVFFMIYENINQIFDGATRLVDNFTDADLSKLDLSHIKPEA